MDKFLVPQFIEVEAKIIGPITVRQFIIMVAALILIFIEYKLLTFWTFTIVGVLTFAIAGVFAFLKINGQAFHYFLLNVIETFKNPNLRIWRREITKAEAREMLEGESQSPKKQHKIPRKRLVASSHLEELSLVVNTGGAYESSVAEIKQNYEKSKKQE